MAGIGTISIYAQKRCIPSINKLQEVAEILSTPMSCLFGYTDNPSKDKDSDVIDLYMTKHSFIDVIMFPKVFENRERSNEC